MERSVRASEDEKHEDKEERKGNFGSGLCLNSWKTFETELSAVATTALLFAGKNGRA